MIDLTFGAGVSPTEDRAIGALLGLAAGDAVGTAVEFARPGSFEPLTDLVGGGPFRLPAGAWTDDTSMALCLAESLVDTGTMDLPDQLRRYVAWWRNGHLSSTGTCFDIGATTASQLRRFERTGEAIDPHPDPESAANGSLMRLAAVPIRWHADLAEAAARSAESSRTTHAATRPVDSCRLLGAMVAALIDGADPEAVLSPDFWRWGPLDPAVEAVARGSWRDAQPPRIRGTGYCVDALEAALWAVGGASDFRDAILRAANLGDDADTTAAIAGQLAGARWGASGIPQHWRDRLVLAPRIIELARSLFRAGRADDSPRRWVVDQDHHGWWVDDHLLAGEYPATRADPIRTHMKVNLLLDAGIRTIIDLTRPQEGLDPYAYVLEKACAIRGRTVTRIHHPIEDMGITTDDHYRQIVDDIAAADGPVYVHCWGGIGRTSTVVGIHLARTGLSPRQIQSRIDDLRAPTKKAHKPAPQKPEQRAVFDRFATG